MFNPIKFIFRYFFPELLPGQVWDLRASDPWMRPLCEAHILEIREGWVKYRVGNEIRIIPIFLFPSMYFLDKNKNV